MVPGESECGRNETSLISVKMFVLHRMNNNTELNLSDLCGCVWVGIDIAYEGCSRSNLGWLFYAHVFLKYYCSR
jgi:hypothetical protein